MNENQTTLLYVDAQVGSDSNSGAKTLPLRTIQAAINKANANNQKGTGTRILVNPGIYRETVMIANSKSTAAPLTVQAVVTGTAIIAGSDVLSGWTQDSTGVFSHLWTTRLGNCAIPAGWPAGIPTIARRAEMLFVNGVPLTEVLSSSDLRPGTFYVDESASLIHMLPPAAVNVAASTVEAAVRSADVTVQGRTNVVLRGLAFRHAAGCLNTSAVSISSSSNVLLDSVQAQWNNWGGILIGSSTSITIQNSMASYNGGYGFGGIEDQNILLTFNESDYNNWRGAQGALYNWGMGGTKLLRMRNATVQNHFAYRNQAQGLWFDTDNQNVVINQATLSENLLSALQVEANEGPILLESSRLCSSGSGVDVLNSQKVTISNNVFYNNSGTNTNEAEIFIAGNPGGRQVSDWITGQTYTLFTAGLNLTGNIISDAAGGQVLFGTYLSGSDWTQFTSTFSAQDNSWFDPATGATFRLPSNKFVPINLWQSAVGTDLSSIWAPPVASPVAACSAPAPSFPDFSINLDQESYAMVAGRAVATARIRSFAFNGTVSLRVTGLPAGVTATLSQSSLVGGVVTVTLSAASNAVAQTVPVTLWATSGSRVRSVTVDVSVKPA